ncbi:MAG: hypothetical protein M0Q13_05840 [Methanothrix sp.]|jgi:uncharacterized spore protein YtfJ|nr:hypothetical protein [Methanothrix sp.]
MSGVDAIGATLDELFDALSAQLIGDPIELEDKIIIPITKMSMGFGTNINMGRTGPDVSKEGLERCTAGGGVGIFPAVVVVVFKGIFGPEGVKVIPVSPQLEETIADIAYVVVEKIMGHKNTREKRTDNIVAIKVE